MGLFYTWRAIQYGFPDYEIQRLWYSDEAISRAAILYFATYLVMDLVIGAFDYKDCIDFLSGYIHHIFYFLLSLILLYSRIGNIFCIFFVMEVPTVVLSFGHINKEYRRDKLFGFTFFSTRILLHGFLLIHLFWRIYMALWIVCLTAFFLHAHWFRAWINQQLRLHSKTK